MGLKVRMSIDGARQVDAGVWMAKIEPNEAVTLGSCDSKSGLFSVLLLESTADYDEESQTITFDPDATKLINIGSTDRALVLSSNNVEPDADSSVTATAAERIDSEKPAITPPPEPAEPAPKKISPREKETDIELSDTLSTGDKLFLSELPIDLRDLGERLLSGVRKRFPGELNYEPRTAKFDETPEIFWTVKIQSRNKSLRITVRGRPESFKKSSGIQLQNDQFGYSAFVLTRKNQIRGALSTIRQAYENMA